MIAKQTKMIAMRQTLAVIAANDLSRSICGIIQGPVLCAYSMGGSMGSVLVAEGESPLRIGEDFGVASPELLTESGSKRVLHTANR